MKKLLFFAGVLLAVIHPLAAKQTSPEQEIHTEWGSPSEQDLPESDTYFRLELGLSHLETDSPIVGSTGGGNIKDYTEFSPLLLPIISGRFDFKRFFYQIDAQGSLTDTAFGYSLYHSERNQLDVVVVSLFNAPVRRKNISGLENIRDRDIPPMLGVSHILNFGDNFFRSELVGGNFGKKGPGFNALFTLGREQQLGNWSASGSLLAGYSSEAVLDHIFGISASEALEEYPEFSANGGFSAGVNIGARYPLTENVVFSAGASHTFLSESIADSPLVLGDSITVFQFGLSYVFGGG